MYFSLWFWHLIIHTSALSISICNVLIATEYSSERMYHNFFNHSPTMINNAASMYLTCYESARIPVKKTPEVELLSQRITVTLTEFAQLSFTLTPVILIVLPPHQPCQRRVPNVSIFANDRWKMVIHYSFICTYYEWGWAFFL